MKWIIEEFWNINNNSLRIESALRRLNIDYLIVNLSSGIRVIDKKSRVPLDNSDEIIEKFCKDEEVIVYGSKKMEDLVYRLRIYPGMYKNDSFEYDYFVERLGNKMLNHDLKIGTIDELEITAETFIRPVDNSKLFTGQVVDEDSFGRLKVAHKGAKDPIMISSIKDILKEYRVFVVNGKVTAGSSYVINGKYNIERHLNEEVIDFVESIHKEFPISKAYVIDIAETNIGYKVIEYNNINTSGLYGGDELKIVQAIQSL